jgi:outer membrane protein assembly factor BamB
MTLELPVRSLKALCLLGASALLLSTATAQKQTAPKKTDAQKKSAATQKPTAKPTPAAAKADAQAKPQARQVEPAVLVRWAGKPGINRYRLQLATDQKFTDIVFDQAVEGNQYVVKGLPPGNYFWRVAPAVAETSTDYTQPERIELSNSTDSKVEVANVVMPAETAGWRTATGEVLTLVPAQLRPGGVVDFVGVGSDGRAFAIDGASGISLWTSRYGNAAAGAAPAASVASPFTPVVVKTKQGETDVVVANDGGVKALRGETGKELWRASLEGRAACGVATDLNGDGGTEVVVVTANPDKLYILDPGTGRVNASQNLDDEASGAPYPVEAGGKRGFVVGLKKGRVQLRGADGAVVAEAKVEGAVTTPPLVIKTPQMSFAVVGTDNGLWALSVPEMKVLGVIKAEDDSVRGTLAAADVDGDGSPEIAMVTKKGRVALVNTTDGNVRWSSEGATDAASAAFADVNGDGILDVIVAGGKDFALAFSGRDGSLVMKVEEGGRRPAEQKAGGALRSLVVVPSVGGGATLAGSDPERMGLRAVELPKGSIKTASK